MKKEKCHTEKFAKKSLGLLLLLATLFFCLLTDSKAISQTKEQFKRAERVQTVSTETHEFNLSGTDGSYRKLIHIPAQPEGRTIQGDLDCDWQSDVELNLTVVRPFASYLYKSCPNKVGLEHIKTSYSSKGKFSYTTDETDAARDCGYLFSISLNHAMVRMQCRFTNTITEVVSFDLAPQQFQNVPVPEAQKIPRSSRRAKRQP